MNDRQKMFLKIFALSLVSFAVSCVIFFAGIMQGFELKAYDLFSRSLNPSLPSEDVIIIKIDQPSLESLSAEGINWPWPRQIYAPILEYLAQADAIFMDIFFLEPSSYGEQDDEIFASSVQKTSSVYLALSLTNKKEEIRAGDRTFLENVSRGEMIAPAMSFTSVNLPLDILLPEVKGAGNVTIPPDEDGVYRKVPLIFSLGGKYLIPNLVFDYLLKAGHVSIRDGKFWSGDIPIPLLEQNLLLRYSRNPDPFRSISAADILKASADAQASREPSLKKEFFAGKKVFIGLTAAGLLDLKPTAVSPVSTGVQIHATALENILHRNFLFPLHPLYSVACMFFFCLGTSFAVLRSHSLSRNLSYFLIAFIIALALPALLFAKAWYLQIIYPSLALLISFLLAVAYSYATEGRERRFIKMAFSQYMDKKIVDYVLKNPQLIKPGGQRKHVTVFFTDIAGFTSLAEKIPAEEAARILHTILNAFTEVIIQNEGVIDKYIGDAIMAFWGAPLQTERDEVNACNAALRCLSALEEINRQFTAAGLSEIAIRIGIHSGDAIVGNLGSDRLFDYTAIGDTVNLTSRLESANKFFKTKIILTEDTLKKTGDLFFSRELGMIEVKGKSVPVRIFELLSWSDHVSPSGRELVTLFDEGLALFNNREWEAARAVFSGILQKNAEDGPSAYYEGRCQHLLSSPVLTDGWNIIKMTEK